MTDSGSFRDLDAAAQQLVSIIKERSASGKVRAKLLHCSKNEARVSYSLESGPMISFKIG